MMITCEHCGTAVDVEKEKRCPNCGASYARNKDYKEYKSNMNKSKEYDFRERELDINQKEIANELLKKNQEQVEKQFKNTNRMFTFVGIISAIIFIIVFAFIIFVFAKMFNY